MNKQWSAILTAGSAAASLSLVQPAQALTSSERFERLEKHIEQLEQRLDKSETENHRLKQEIQRGYQTPPTTTHSRLGRRDEPGIQAPISPTKTVNADEFKKLDKAVHLLERKFEVEKEVSDTSRKSAAKIEAGSNGFKIGTVDGEWQLRLRGFLQADTNSFLNDTLPADQGIGWNQTTQEPNPFNPGAGLASDKFLIRRARLQFAGTLGKYTDFLIAPDFGGGQARLFDAWADFHYWQPASFAIGKMKGPQDLERQQNATNLLFNERAYPTQLAANRQIGAMLHGEIEGPGFDTKYISNINHTQELFSYQLGVFNGSQDNQAVQNSDTTNFDNKEYAARIFAHPFRHVDFEPIQRLGIGFAGNYTDWQGQNGSQSIASLQSQGQSNIVNYATGTSISNGSSVVSAISSTSPDNPVTTTQTTTSSNNTIFSGALLNGSQYHFSPQGYWYWGAFGLLTDWTSSTQTLAVQQTDNAVTTTQTSTRIATGPNSTTTINKTATTTSTTGPYYSHQKAQTNLAWQVAASYVLTGEDNTYWAIKPREPFDPFAGKWGAWQVAFRWHELDVDQDTFTNFGTASKPLYLYSDPRSSIQHASTWGLGATWFLNSNISVKANYEQTAFTGGAVTDAGVVANRPDEKVFFTRVQFWY